MTQPLVLFIECFHITAVLATSPRNNAQFHLTYVILSSILYKSANTFRYVKQIQKQVLNCNFQAVSLVIEVTKTEKGSMPYELSSRLDIYTVIITFLNPVLMA